MTQLATVPSGSPKSKVRAGNPFFMQVVRFVNMFIPTKVDKAKGIIFYGKDNRLPNNLMKWVLDSGTAKKAQNKRAVYIAADGFVNKELSKKQVNEKQTADQLLNEIAGYQAYFKGFALKVQRNLNDEKKLSCLSFQDVRKKTDGTFIYNPTLSSDKYDKTKDIIMHPYVNRKLTTEEFAQRVEHGEIIYAYNKSADNPHYPIPDYYAGIEDVRSSSELQKFDYETVMNAFITSAILTIIGELNDTVEDENGMTERDYMMEELEKFTGNEKDSEGKSGRMKMLVMTAKNKDAVPVLQPFDAKVIVDASNTKRDLIDRAVCRLFGVHPVLIGFSDAQLLGNTQAISNASVELNNDVLPDQRLTTEIFSTVYEGDWTITSFRPFRYIPDALLNELTPEEKRALIGYPKINDGSNTNNKLLSERLGVGGTQSLVSILADALLKPDQKLAALKILFGIPDEEAKQLVGTETTTTA